MVSLVCGGFKNSLKNRFVVNSVGGEGRRNRTKVIKRMEEK